MFAFISSFYPQEMLQKTNKITELENQIEILKTLLDSTNHKIDSLMNLKYKMVAIDSTKNKKTGGIEYFRIYKRDVMIESSYNINIKYVDKIYNSAEKIGVEPWLQLYFGHLENRMNPYDKIYTTRIVRSNKDAYGIMQMTKIGVQEVNRALHGEKTFKWNDVKYNTDINIECSSYYIKFHVMPIYNEFKGFDNIGDIAFWFYNGGDKYGNEKLAYNGYK